VNPIQLVYLSNMSAYGAHTSVNSLFTMLFWNGSTFLAPPGFLVAGPNPGYTWDTCCPSSCGGPGNNALCGPAPLSPPAGQPPQKSFKDFNSVWPLDSWWVSEPNDAYQAEYLRLLSKFVP
jgi:endoglucanase